MAQFGARLEMDPEIMRKLSSGNPGFWRAAHDEEKNRVNWEAVVDAATYSDALGVALAGFQGLRKAFRNRGKSKEDKAAEKEAKAINRTCGALEQMLLEYVQAAQKGNVDAEALQELIDTLEEMDGYARFGKLSVPGERELAAIGDSIAAFTDAIAVGRGDAAAPEAGEAPASAFGRIRAQLIRQQPDVR